MKFSTFQGPFILVPVLTIALTREDSPGQYHTFAMSFCPIKEIKEMCQINSELLEGWMLRLNTEGQGKSSFMDVYSLFITLLSMLLKLKLRRDLQSKNEWQHLVVFFKPLIMKAHI